MDKIVVLVLLIAVTLGLFSFSIMGQVANARGLVDFAEEEQSKVRILLSNPDVVTGDVVLGYLERNDGIIIGLLDAEGAVLLPDNVDPSNYFKTKKEYSNGQLTKITFQEVEF